MKKKLFTIFLSFLTFIGYSQVQKWEDWQNNFNIFNNNALTSPTSRNIGLNLWSDRGFGAELHYRNNTFGTAIYTRSSGEAIWLGNYNSNATQQQNFNPWMTLVNGFVGIGTTSPLTALHVNGYGSFGQSVTVNNATRTLNLVDPEAVMRIIRVHPTNAPAVELISRPSADGLNTAYWDFYAQPSDASFRIRDRKDGGSGVDMVTVAHTSGNVGIGTTNPQSKLQIGNVATDNANSITIPGVYNFEQLKLGQYGNGASGIEMINHASTEGSYGIKFLVNTDDPAGQGLQIKYAPAASSYNTLAYTTGIFLGINGNVGIGTTKPQAKLAVKGTVLAQAVKVSNISTDWPDYVFKSTYKLRSLNALEAFINNHKHLPDVPSAVQVEAAGLDLAQIQAALLKKIEELTLYVIAQGKEIKALKKITTKK